MRSKLETRGRTDGRRTNSGGMLCGGFFRCFVLLDYGIPRPDSPDASFRLLRR